MGGTLEGTLVVALEQAVAAPLCSSRLADAGARVIKVERPGGDFARGYDHVVHGESAYFVWLNRGKESVTLDLNSNPDKAVMERMLGRADISRTLAWAPLSGWGSARKPGARAGPISSPAIFRGTAIPAPMPG